MAKQYTLVATYQSKSTPGKYYEVARDEMGQLSCNCPGWTRRTGKNGERTCSHVEKETLKAEMAQRNSTPEMPASLMKPLAKALRADYLMPRKKNTAQTNTPKPKGVDTPKPEPELTPQPAEPRGRAPRKFVEFNV